MKKNQEEFKHNQKLILANQEKLLAKKWSFDKKSKPSLET